MVLFFLCISYVSNLLSLVQNDIILRSGNLWIGEGSSEYIPIYEDKDGDWMLVGDVPWQ